MPAAKRTQQSPPTHVPAEVVDPVWLIRALAITLAAALLCAWLTTCLLFYQGAWQLVLHPAHNVDRTPASVGLSFTPVRFGDFNTGTPHLTGWWIASTDAGPDRLYAPRARLGRLTILYLHGGSGSLSDALPEVARLHNTNPGLNIFAIDYRGFGASDSSIHPDANLMAEDAAAALDYLITTRHLPEMTILPMGTGLGASIAVHLASVNSEIPGIILDNPDPDPAATAAAARPSRIIPVRLLYGNRFAITERLATITTPKLLIAADPLASAPASASRVEDLYRRAADTKYIVTLPSTATDAAFTDAFHHFLSQYLARN